MNRRRDPLARPEELIRRVYAYVAYVIGDGPDAEDITSETFVRATRYRKSYDPSKGSPATWLVGIARRCIADRPRVPEPTDDIDHGFVEDTSRDDVLAVRAAVARLPERDRELVALRYGADLTARQIAEELGLQTNAVEVALHRLHAKLRVDLAEDFGREPRREARKDFGPATGM
ncbi:MAG TPA: sigma-70 family RNA polymerase sigma factor [Gaiellaceae bacterium]|nr:sigma-70 family RNA polymerase sigma factor [Gaiellaceae bacterium]